MQEYVKMWKRGLDFSGVSTRREYWMAVLVNAVIWVVIEVLANLTLLDLVIVVSYAYALAAAVPGLALAVRRLRDAGKGWTNLLWALLPLAGPVILVVMLAKQTAHSA